MTVIFLLLQVVPVAEVPDSVPIKAIVTIPHHVRSPCETSPEPDEIVVCGKTHDDQFRLKPIKRPAGMKAPSDEPGIGFDIGKAHGNVYATSGRLINGQVDKRIMVTVKIPF